MRIKYYIISIMLGLIHLIGYIIILNLKQWTARSYFVIDSIFITFGFSILGILIWKDIVDERRIRNGESPIGGTYIEHGPYVFMLPFITIFSIFVYPDTIFFKIIIIILSLLVGIWDLSQDYRSKSLR
ncbi:MAG: hypothetical protein HWN67_16730 [Candidatus Helarchaeota archaeon]|nr:hypothetical protein [Candidatus Helarchaeota archaeon]